MSSRLVNVRLDEARLRKAKALRASGLNISELVREAIDERYARLKNTSAPRDIKAIMKQLFEEFPDPPNLPPPDYDVYDRHQAREAIVRKLKSKRRV